MFRPALVGRDELVVAIDTVLAAARGGVALTGPPGSGVSRLLIEVHAMHVGRQRDVVFCRCPDTQPVPSARRADLVVVDDVHLADAETIGVVRELALHTRVLVGLHLHLATSGLAWLWQSGVVERIDVPELSLDDTAALVRATDDALDVHPATFSMLHDQCAGRAGSIVDAVRGIRRAAHLPGGSAWWRAVPAAACATDLADRATASLAQLDSADRELVELLALTGPVPRTSMVDTAAVDRLTPAWLVTGADDLVHVVPPVAVTTLRCTLPPERHRALATEALARWADVIRSFDRTRLDPQVSSPQLVVDAARAAQRAGDLTSALELVDRLGADDGVDALRTSAEVRDAIGQRTEAAALYERIGADPAMPDMDRALAQFEQSNILLWDLGEPDRAQAVASSLRNTAAGSDFERLAAALETSIELYRGRTATAAATSRRALDTCPLDDLGWFPWSHVRITGAAVSIADDGLDDGERAHLSTILATTPPGSALWASQFVALSLALELAGRIGDARRLLESNLDLAASAPTATATAWLSLARARVELAAGQVDDAAAWGAQSAAGFLDTRHPTGLRWATGARLLAAAMSNDATTCRALLADLDQMGDGAVAFLDAELLRARAWAHVACGDRSTGLADLRAAAEAAEQCGALALAMLAVHDLARLGAPDPERLRQLAAGTAPGVDQAMCRHAAAIGGRDAPLLIAVSDDLATEGRMLAAAETATTAARVARAAGLRATARDAADRAARWRSRCAGANTPALADGASAALSRRERDVALLASQSMSSKAIAAQLALSPRTVDNLLQRAFAKLGVSSRRDLAARLEPAPTGGGGRSALSGSGDGDVAAGER